MINTTFFNIDLAIKTFLIWTDDKGYGMRYTDDSGVVQILPVNNAQGEVEYAKMEYPCLVFFDYDYLNPDDELMQKEPRIKVATREQEDYEDDLPVLAGKMKFIAMPTYIKVFFQFELVTKFTQDVKELIAQFVQLLPLRGIRTVDVAFGGIWGTKQIKFRFVNAVRDDEYNDSKRYIKRIFRYSCEVPVLPDETLDSEEFVFSNNGEHKVYEVQGDTDGSLDMDNKVLDITIVEE